MHILTPSRQDAEPPRTLPTATLHCPVAPLRLRPAGPTGNQPAPPWLEPRPLKSFVPAESARWFLENSPVIYHWVLAHGPHASRQGRKRILSSLRDFELLDGDLPGHKWLVITHIVFIHFSKFLILRSSTLTFAN